MQQISDHVRQEFIAMSALCAQPAQNASSSASAYIRRTTDVAPPGCHYQSHSGLVPFHAANHHIHPAYTTDTFRDTRLEPQPFHGTHMSSGWPPSVLSYSMHGQQHALPQQLFASNHSLPQAQHHMLAPAGQPAIEHLQALPTDRSFAPQAAAACRQPGSHVAADSSLQHASPVSDVHGVSPWQYNGPPLPQNSSPLLCHAALSEAEASSTAPSCCPGQPQSTMAPQHAAAVGVPLSQGDGTAQGASTNQPSGLVFCPNQSMPFAHDPMPRVSPVSAALGSGSSIQGLVGTTACGAAKHGLNNLAGQMPRQPVGAAMPATQEAVSSSAQLFSLQRQQSSSVQQQQQPRLPLPHDRLAPSSLSAQQQQATLPGKPGPAPSPGLNSIGARGPSTAVGLSFSPTAAEQQQPATSSLAITASCPAATCSASALIPPMDATGDVSIHRPTAPGSTAAPSMHILDSRAAPDPAPFADMVKSSVVPQHIAWPGNSLPAQSAASPPGVPGQVAPLDTLPQLRQTPDIYASNDSRSAAASLPLGVGHAGVPTEQVASDGSFRFQPQTDCVHVSAGVCCTPVLRPRSQEVAYAGMPAAMYSLLSKGPSMQSCSAHIASHALVLHTLDALCLSHLCCWMTVHDLCNSTVEL